MSKTNMADDLREKLEKRQEERLSELDRRKQERAKQTRPEENPESLMYTFVKEKDIVEKMLLDSAQVEKNVLREHFDELTRKSQLLQKFLSDSLLFLPSYDVKQLQRQVNKLQQDINDQRSHYLPKKKFAFSKKKQSTEGRDLVTKIEEHVEVATYEKNEPEDVDINKKSKDKEEGSTPTSDFIISGQRITREQTDLQEKDISFSNLRDCTIVLYGSPSALHLEKLEWCKVFCGPVSGSIFINNCKDCMFIFPCQQLRVHTTIRSQFYLHVTSRAIIEDCLELGFAEFNWSYNGMDDHFKSSRLDHTKNNWDLVNDFNWLRTDLHSPNWYLIKDKNKINCWD